MKTKLAVLSLLLALIGQSASALTVDVTGTSQYPIIIKQDGVEVGRINAPSAGTTTPPVVVPPVVAVSGLYVNPEAQVARYVAQYPALKAIADTPTSIWLGEWSGDVTAAVSKATTDAKAKGKTPSFAVYRIPNRDNGGYSAGGASSPTEYKAWIDKVAAGVKTRSLFVLEPDALAASNDSTRTELLKYAGQKLMATGSAVYIDIGHSAWLSSDEAANRLHTVDVRYVTGFALNVSNFQTTANSVAYGQAISNRLATLGDGMPHFIVDTSRNGNGPTPDNQWCNPAGRKLGDTPTLTTGKDRVDAYLWVKSPAESDGSCNGNPAAGQVNIPYALGLIK